MTRRLTSVILTFLLLASVPAFGQGTRGSLRGLVADPNGAAINGATVTLKQVGTNEEFKATTDSQGAFVFPSLPPGKYSATVEASGFKRTELTEVIIEVNQQAKVDISLEVGAVTEQVTVTGTAQEVINTTSPTLSKTINAKQVNDLPLLSRNPIDLARLQAGIAVTGTDIRNASVGGLRGTATNITQDGINAMDNFVKTGGFFALTAPSLNSTSEFSITVGTTGSDAGRGVAQVSFVTPSGTNSLHGSVFYQHRNDALNAANFFDNSSNTQKEFLRQHFFGVSSSGPLWIPKIYDGRNRSFWFFSYEGFREPFSETRNRTVLTQEARNGIFRYTGANGQLQTVNLLALGTQHSFNPLTTAQINAMPLPNNTLVGDTFNTGGWRYNVPGRDPNDKFNGRFDQELFSSEKWGSHKAEFVYHTGDFLITPDTFNNNESNFPGLSINGTQASTRTLWTAAVHSIFGAHMTNEARVGHQAAPVGFLLESQPTTFLINLGSVSDLDQDFQSQGRNTQVWQFVDNFSLVKRAHTFKMGTDVQRLSADTFNDAGIYQFININQNNENPDGLSSGNFPNLPAGSAGTAVFNRARSIYRDLVGLLGSSTKTFNITSPDSGFVEGATRSRANKYTDVSFYFQDAWKMKRNLTFSYGLRYEFLGVPTVPDGIGIQVTNVNDIFGVGGPGNLFNPNSRAGNPSATLDFVSGETGKGLYKNDWNNFAPFIGFAYSPNFQSGPLHWIFGGEGRSSIRAGYSISYLRDGFTVVTNALGTGTTNPGLIATASNTTPQGVLASAGLPLTTPVFKIPITSAENFAANPGNGTTTIGNGLWAFDQNLRTPYVQQWSLGIERELSSNMALEVRYQGNHAVKIFRALDYNEVNIFENGFLQEFLNAQNNLAIFKNANPNCGQSGQPACSFRNAGLPGQFNLPTLSTLFGGLSAANGFASTTFIPNLEQNNIGSMAATLAYASTYRANRANLPPAFFVTNPNAAFARVLGNFAFSNYHSLQVELRRRFSAGLQFQASYTLSKAFTNSNGSQSTLESARTLRNFRLDKALSDQDQRHRFISNIVYDLPFGTGRRFGSGLWSPARKAIEGWTVGAIVTYATRPPFYFTSDRSTFNNFNPGTNPAQLIGMTFEEFKKHLGVFRAPQGVFFIDPKLLDFDESGTATLKEGILGAPAPGTFGNFPINSLRGPNFTQTDISLVKRTYFTERANVEFRMIAFNVFNHPNFSYSGDDFDDTNFGLINSTSGTGQREISFAISINW